MTKSYEDSFSDVHLKPTSHSCRSDGVCKCEQPTQEHSMTYEDGFTHGYDAHLADYKEQPTQEPVAWMNREGTYAEFSNKTTVYGSHTIPLYTHPKEWQGLSDDEISYTWAGFAPDAIDFARAIEAKLKELNT